MYNVITFGSATIDLFVKSDPAVIKIKKEEVVYGKDMEKLEDNLNSADIYINETNLQKIYEQKRTLSEFLKHILKIKKLQSPEEKIDEEFRTFTASHSHIYNSNQINFLRTLQTVFTKKKHIEYKASLKSHSLILEFRHQHPYLKSVS